MRTKRKIPLLGAALAVLTATSMIAVGGVSVASGASANAIGTVTPGDLIVRTYFGGQSADPTACWAFQISYPGVRDMAVEYKTAAGVWGEMSPESSLPNSQDSAGFCLMSDQRGVTDPMNMTVKLSKAGVHVADIEVSDAVATPSERTAASLLHQINRMSADDVKRMNLCVALGIAFPSKAILKTSTPDITVACNAETVFERRSKLAQALAGLSAVALWQHLLRVDNPNPDPEPGPGPCTTGVCQSPDPDPVPDPDPDPAPEEVSERGLLIERIQERALQKGLALAVEDVETAADTCLATQQRFLASPGPDLSPNYTGGNNPCLEYAIFFPGADAGGAAIHDREAILARPEWAALTYRDKKTHHITKNIDGVDAVVPDGWYTAVKWAGADRTCVNMAPRDGLDCDEYPYISTMEGGPGASLKLVPHDENTNEGTALQKMYNDADCGMAAAGGSGSTQFLVVPVAVEPSSPGGSYGGPDSFHICSNEKYMPKPPGWGIS